MQNTRQIVYWTIGGMGGELPIEEALEKARKMGFDGLEPTFGDTELKPGVSEKRCKEIRQAAKSLGVKMESLATGTYWACSLSDPRASVRKKAVDFTKEYLRVARWLSVKVVLVVPGAVGIAFEPDARVVPYADVWNLSSDSLRKCLPTAKRLGVTIAIENVWNYFLTDPMAMNAFIDQFKTDRVGAYFDCGNCVINGYPQHWIDILGKRIKAVHVKAFTRENGGGTLANFGKSLKNSSIDWKAVVKALKAIKYTGPLTAEMLPPDDKVAERTATQMGEIFG